MTRSICERLRDLLDRATPGPWAWEQCGDKCDAPVVGVIVDADCKPLSGCVEMYNEDGSERDYYRETIAYEWQDCDGHSASANAMFVVEAVNALPGLLTLIETQAALLEECEGVLGALVEAAMDDEPWEAFPIAKHAGLATLAKLKERH